MGLLSAGVQTVNTNINWPGLVVSLASFIACMAGIVTFIDRKQDKRSQAIADTQNSLREEFRKSLESAAAILSERLETKDNVNELRVEVAKMSAQLKMMTSQNGNLLLFTAKAVVDTKWRQSDHG